MDKWIIERCAEGGFLVKSHIDSHRDFLLPSMAAFSTIEDALAFLLKKFQPLPRATLTVPAPAFDRAIENAFPGRWTT